MSESPGDRGSAEGTQAPTMTTTAAAVVREELKPALRPLQVASLALGCIIGFGALLPGEKTVGAMNFPRTARAVALSGTILR